MAGVALMTAFAAISAGVSLKKSGTSVSGGKAVSKCALALDYIYGENGRKTDFEKAWNLFNEASAAGSVDALYYMAEMYNYGMYVPEDMTKYLSTLQQAADLGSVDALADLGALTLYGSRRVVLPKDENKGMKMLMSAADKGNTRAMVYLGHCFRDGLAGTVRDGSRAYTYYNKAAAEGNPQGYVEMAKCHISGYGAEENPDKAFVLLIKAENEGCADASRMLGNMYYHGEGRAPNDSIARVYYNTAIEGGNVEAMADLGWMYIKGGSGFRMFRHAFDLFSKASSEDVPGAIEGLGICYENGYGTPLDMHMAVSCYKRAASSGSDRSLYHLYRLYRNGGTSFPQDLVMARSYLDQGVGRGDGNSLYALGNEYIKGGLVEKDSIKGIEFIRKAADMGCVQALAELGNMYYLQSKAKGDYTEAFNCLYKAIKHPEEIDDAVLARAYRNIAACYRFGRGTVADIDKANAYTSMSSYLGDYEMGDVMRFFNTDQSY